MQPESKGKDLGNGERRDERSSDRNTRVEREIEGQKGSNVKAERLD